jgi:membrane-associated phospholipid phosphatase
MGDTPEHRRSAPVRFLVQAAVLAAIMLASLSLYLVVLRWRGPAAAVATQTAWDRRLPFSAAWVWVYLLPYLIGPLAVGLLSRDTFLWFVRRGLIVVCGSLVVFVLYPTKTVRPPLPADDGPTAHLYRHMVEIDEPPANAAPSLHVSLTCLLAWALVRDFPRWWPVTLLGVGLVWLATLLTWQHHLIDVATGVLLASLVALPWHIPIKRSRPPIR